MSWHPFHFESKHDPLIPRDEFKARVMGCFCMASLLVSGSLVGGMAGYHWCENLSWIDSFANASMILSGMGPLAQPQTFGGKLFSGCYALYSGLALVLVSGLLISPFFHRLLHKFHLEKEGDE